MTIDRRERRWRIFFIVYKLYASKMHNGVFVLFRIGISSFNGEIEDVYIQ